MKDGLITLDDDHGITGCTHAFTWTSQGNAG